VDDTLENEFSDCFPLGNDPIQSVMMDVHHFKRTPPNTFSLHDYSSLT